MDHSWNSQTPLPFFYNRWRLGFLNFPKKEGLDFSNKKGKVGKMEAGAGGKGGGGGGLLYVRVWINFLSFHKSLLHIPESEFQKSVNFEKQKHRRFDT